MAGPHHPPGKPPSPSEAQIAQAAKLYESERYADAGKICRDVLTRDPTNVLAYHILANIAMHADNAAMVLALSDAALKIQPDFAILHQNRATALRRQAKRDEAEQAILHAIKLDPHAADFYDTYAMILRDQRRFPEALAAVNKALEIQPNRPQFLNAKAIILVKLNAPEEALATIEDYIKLRPKRAEGHNNRANILKSLRRYREAIESYTEALKHNPSIYMGKANKGMAHLVLGEFERGWELFEHRTPAGKPPEAGLFDPARRWKGETDKNATIVLYHEQGVGDTIQFCRYIPWVAERVGRVIVSIQPSMHALLATNYPQAEVQDVFEPISTDYTYQCPLMSLPYVFKSNAENIPFAKGYLTPDAAKVAAWKQRLPQDNNRRIGIVWAGNPNHMNDHVRSVPVQLFEPLWSVPNTHFFSMQKGDGALQQMAALPSSLPFTYLGDELNDFGDTAALLANIDLLISVDTSVLHLAGAIGTPAWGLIQYDPDYRWMLERNDTPWYDSIRLFRQNINGNWAEVMSRVKLALGKL